MPAIVTVTSAQVAAAKLFIERAAAAGKDVPPEVLAIANAKPPHRQAAADKTE